MGAVGGEQDGRGDFRAVGQADDDGLGSLAEALDAQTALAWGLVTEVVPAAELETAALGIARRMAANPAHGLRLTKRLLREGQHMRLDSLLEMSAAYQALAHGTRDHREAVDSMLEKRAPKFEGR